MDYYSMKRRELQALCKEHNIPANSANSVMADKLSELFNEKQKPRTRQTCMKSSVDTTDESEPAVLRKQAKKVTFSPEVDLLGSELRSGKKRKAMVTDMKVRRKSVAKKVDNDDNVELIDDSVQNPVRLTRSRVQTLGNDDVVPGNEKKQGRRAVKKIKTGTDAVVGTKGNLGEVTRSKVNTLGKGGGVQPDKNKPSKGAVNYVEKASQSVEEKLAGRVRVTRSKAQTMIEDGTGPDLNPQVKKRSGRRVVNDSESVELPKEMMDIPVRVTRARGQTITDDSANTVNDTLAEKRRSRRDTRGADLSNKSINVAPGDNQDLPKRKLLRNMEVDVADEGAQLGHGRQKKKSEEIIAEGSESRDHADKGMRQSRRNKSKVEVFTVLNQNVSKVELVNDRKITRSRAPLTVRSSGGDDKSDIDNKVEESLEHAGRRNATRRKSVIQPEKTEVINLEGPIKRQSRKDARQKRVMQETEGNEIDKPLNGKRKLEKENEMVGSSNSPPTHRTVGKKLSKEQCGNLSMVKQAFDIKENVTRLGNAAPEIEMKTVASTAGSHISRKRRGDSIIEDQIIETMYISTVEESPRRSTRSVSKNEGKSVARPHQSSVRKKQESNLKTSATRMNNTSKKRVKLSGTKRSDSEDHAEKSNSKRLPVSKLQNVALDEEVIQTKHTPVIYESVGRFTRSAIRSESNAVGSSLGKVDRKKPSQSAIKDQRIEDVQLSSRKVANFRRDPVLSTAPGRFTRSGIKRSENAGPGQSEVSKGVEHPSALPASDFERLPIKGVEENSISMSVTPTVMENVNSVSGEVATERDIGKEVTEVPFADIEKSSIQSTKNLTTHETSATSYLTENLLGGKQQTPVNLPNFEDETLPGMFLSDIKRTPFSTAKIPESVIDAPSDGSRLQNQSRQVYMKSALFGEAEVQEAVDTQKSVLKSARPEIHEKEMESTKSRSSSMGLQDVMLEEPVSLVEKNDVEEITKENDGDAYYAGSSAVTDVSFEQSDVKRISNELETPLEPPILEGVKHLISDDGADQDALTSNEPLQNHPLGEHEVANNGEYDDEEKTAKAADEIDAHEIDSVVGGYDLEPNKDNALEQSIGDDNVQGLAVDENGIKNDVVSPQDRCDVAHKMDFIVEENDMEPNRDDALEQSTGGDMLQGLAPDEEEIKDDVITGMDRCDVSDGIDCHKMDSVVGEYDTESYRDDALEPLAGDDKLQGLLFDENEIEVDLVTARGGCDVADRSDNLVDAGMELAKEVELEVVPSTGNDVREIHILGETDRENVNVNDTKEGEADSVPLAAANMLDDSLLSGGDADGEDESDGANKEHESSPMLSTEKGGFDISFLGNVDDFNRSLQVEPDILETLFSGNGVDGECDNAIDDRKSYPIPSSDNDVSGIPMTGKDDVEGDSTNMCMEPEPVLEPLNAINTFEAPVSGNDVAVECVIGDKIDDKDGESEQVQERLTGNDSPVVDGRQDFGNDSSELSQSENMAVVPEVLVASSDQEPEPMLNVTVDGCASIGQSDSLASKDTPQTPAISGNDVADVRFDALESKLDINNDGISDDLRDNDVLTNAISVMDTENDGGIEHNVMGTSEPHEGVLSLEGEGVPVDVSNEQITEEGEPATENDHEPIITTVDHDSDGDKAVENPMTESQLAGIIKTDENPTGEKSSPIMFRKEEYQLMGDIGGHESMITEEHLPITYKNKEPLVDDMVSDPPTLIKEHDTNKQDKSENTSSSLDWGNYSFRTDEFQIPVSANGSEDVLGETMKDEQHADLQTSARASSSLQESSSIAIEFVDSVTNLEKTSKYVADGKSNQDVDMPKENANTDLSSELNWPDSSLKALLTTPATTRISSETAVSFSFHDDSRDNDADRYETAAYDFNRQWGNEPSSISDGYATQNTSLSKDLKTEAFGVLNLEDDQVKQHDLLGKAAGTHHHDSAQPEGSETGEDSAASKGSI